MLNKQNTIRETNNKIHNHYLLKLQIGELVTITLLNQQQLNLTSHGTYLLELPIMNT